MGTAGGAATSLRASCETNLINVARLPANTPLRRRYADVDTLFGSGGWTGVGLAAQRLNNRSQPSLTDSAPALPSRFFCSPESAKSARRGPGRFTACQALLRPSFWFDCDENPVPADDDDDRGRFVPSLRLSPRRKDGRIPCAAIFGL
jgi:hypothetical protein